MKRRTLILLLAALVASAAGCSQARKSTICAGPGGMEPYAADQEVRYYAEAVESLGEQLANRLKTPPRKNYGPSIDSYYILNADADNGTETELARRFIDDLTDELANEGIRLKRQEMLGWPRITGNEMAVECEEVLRQAAADHFLEFSLVDCPDAFDCKIAKIRLVDGCDILLTEENAFFLKGNPLDWSKKLNELEPKTGEPNAPYEDFDEAARQMVGRIACFLNHMLPDRSGIRIVVGKTDRTSEDAAVAVSHAVSFFGFQKVIPSNSRYMKVAMDTQSGFQLGMYEDRKYPDYAVANVVVAFDVAPVSSRLVQAKITVLALEDIAIIDNGAIQTVKNGMVLPKCVADGYVKMPHTAYYSTSPPTTVAATSPTAAAWADETIVVEGIGACNKNWDRALWPQSARQAAKLDAKDKLSRQLLFHIRKSIGPDLFKLHENSIKGACRAYIRMAVAISETYNEKTCTATVKVAAKASDALPDLLSNQACQPREPSSRTNGATSQRFPNASREKQRTIHAASDNVLSLPSSTAEVRQGTDETTIREIERMMRQKLGGDGISNRTLALMSLSGSMGAPDCYAEDPAGLLPEGVEPLLYCYTNYDLDLRIRSRAVIHCSHRVKGLGRNKNKTHQDAIAGIAEYIYPIALDIAQTLDRRITLEELRDELDVLNQAHWNVAQDLDTDAMLSFIESQIEDLGN